MAKARVSGSGSSAPRFRPAIMPEARENQLISLAEDMAEKQLREGTASSQVVSHYLKIGSQKYSLELERLRNENELIKARAEDMRSVKRTDELYEEAIRAMRNYSGNGDIDDY